MIQTSVNLCSGLFADDFHIFSNNELKTCFSLVFRFSTIDDVSSCRKIRCIGCDIDLCAGRNFTLLDGSQLSADIGKGAAGTRYLAHIAFINFDAFRCDLFSFNIQGKIGRYIQDPEFFDRFSRLDPNAVDRPADNRSI